MLLFLAITFLVLAGIAYLVIGFAEGMATAPHFMWKDYWLVGIFLVLGIVCLVLHHLLRNHPVSL